MKSLLGMRASGCDLRSTRITRRRSWSAFAAFCALAFWSPPEKFASAQITTGDSTLVPAGQTATPESSPTPPEPDTADKAAFVPLDDSYDPLLEQFNLHKDCLRFIGLFSPS